MNMAHAITLNQNYYELQAQFLRENEREQKHDGLRFNILIDTYIRRAEVEARQKVGVQHLLEILENIRFILLNRSYCCTYYKL